MKTCTPHSAILASLCVVPRSPIRENSGWFRVLRRRPQTPNSHDFGYFALKCAALMATVAVLWLAPCSARLRLQADPQGRKPHAGRRRSSAGSRRLRRKRRRGWWYWPTTIPCNAMPAGAGRCGSRAPSSRAACTATRTARSSCDCRRRVTCSRQWLAWTATNRPATGAAACGSRSWSAAPRRSSPPCCGKAWRACR